MTAPLDLDALELAANKATVGMLSFAMRDGTQLIYAELNGILELIRRLRSAEDEAGRMRAESADARGYALDLERRLRAEEAAQEINAPSHEQLMAGYEISCKFGVYESKAFDLAEQMFKAMRAK